MRLEEKDVPEFPRIFFRYNRLRSCLHSSYAIRSCFSPCVARSSNFSRAISAATVAGGGAPITPGR
jgi:hypothetical protein